MLPVDLLLIDSVLDCPPAQPAQIAREVALPCTSSTPAPPAREGREHPNTKRHSPPEAAALCPNGHTTGATVTELLANVQQITPTRLSAAAAAWPARACAQSPIGGQAARWVAVPLAPPSPPPAATNCHWQPCMARRGPDHRAPTARHTIVPSNGPTNRESPVLNAAQRPPVMRPGAEDFRRVPSVESSRRKEAA